ncbi:NTP transferase domain-containing protein [Paenibacillus sp. WLX1005]|uniref:nucleotidyltransferase family protein n=1 Tax=Paenibacillus sp. WLX1005 TaxID=3243766 RepID=UPI003983DC2B
MNIAALVLAAGNSSRMGRDKLSLPLSLPSHSPSALVTPDETESRDSSDSYSESPTRSDSHAEPIPMQMSTYSHPAHPITIGGNVLSAVMAAQSLQSVVVVRSPHSSAAWVAECDQWQQQSDGRLQTIVCEQADQGMSYSIRTGMRQIVASGASHVLIVLADQPLIETKHLQQLTQYALDNPQLDYVAASYKETAMPPIVFSQSVWQQLTQLQGDQGARKLLSSDQLHGAVIPMPAHIFYDADTPEALATIRRHLSEN